MATNKLSNEQMEEELDIDCAPMPEGDHLRSSKLLHPGVGKEQFDDRFDSAYSSGLKSICSESENLSSEINEGRSITDEEGLIPVSNFQNLSLNVDALSRKADPKNLASIDEGFYSQDLPLDLSRKCEDRVTDNKKSKSLENKEFSPEELQAFVQHVEETFQQDDDGDTRLHTAVIQLLSEYGLYCISLAPCAKYLNIKNNYLQTPIHLATITRQANLVRKLMTSGAQVDARDHHGNTPLHIASKEGYPEVVKILLEPVNFSETSGNSYDIPYQAIPQDLEGRNYDGQVCVHLAAEGCHLETLSLLLDNGADVNCRDGKSGRTILHYAAESGCIPLLQFLLKRTNIDVNAMTYSRLTPVMLARGRGNSDAVRLLKERGAYVESDDSEEEEMNEEPYDDFRDAKIGGNPV